MYLILGLAGLITGDIMNDPRKKIKKREDIEEFDWELEDKKYD